MRRGEKRNVGRGTESDRIRMEEGVEVGRASNSTNGRVFRGRISNFLKNDLIYFRNEMR